MMEDYNSFEQQSMLLDGERYVGFDEPHEREPNPSSSSEDNPTSSDDEMPAIPTGRVPTATASEITLEVTNALKSRHNMLIECPPGLDRRIHILGSVLNYYKWRKGLDRGRSGESSQRTTAPNPSRIYLAVQDFQEMERVMKEIKDKFETSDHLKRIKIAALASKKHLCLHDIRESRDPDSLEKGCRQMIQNYNSNQRRGCQSSRFAPEICGFYQNSKENNPDQVFSFTEDHRIFEGALLIRDIEDFVGHGRETSRCPFFDNQLLHSRADLVLCPVDILLSPLLRREYKIELRDAIIIIDEGHDIEHSSLEVGSARITADHLMKAGATLRNLSSQENAMNLLSRLAEPLMSLADWIRTNAKNDSRPSKEEILDQLSNLNVNPENVNDILDAIDNLPVGNMALPNFKSVDALKQFFTILCIASNNSDDYFIKVTEIVDKDRDESQPAVLMVCSNAQVIFGHVGRPALSVIIGGDCLSPISPLHELGVTFQEVVQIRHDPQFRDKYVVGYCSKGPSEEEYALGYESRGHLVRKKEVALAILRLSKIIPNGLVVLFHSRRYLQQILSYLQKEKNGETTFMAQIEAEKHVFSELRMKPEKEEDDMNEYRRLSTAPEGGRNGAILFADGRDSLLKKHHLKEKEIRGIIHVSISYGAWHHNDIIVGRRKYFTSRDDNHHPPDHDETNLNWYESEAFRKTNQSFARVVQNSQDWGVVVILDSRMHAKRHEFPEYLPAWVSNLNLLRRFKFSSLVENLEGFVASRNGLQ